MAKFSYKFRELSQKNNEHMIVYRLKLERTGLAGEAGVRGTGQGVVHRHANRAKTFCIQGTAGVVSS